MIDPGDPASASTPELQQVWDLVYGAGFYRSHVLGNPWDVRASLTGPGGAVAVVEIQDMMAQPRLAVALDDQKNIYKVTFN